MEKLATDKHSSFLRKSVNYDRKKFYSTGPCIKRSDMIYVECQLVIDDSYVGYKDQCYKTFLIVTNKLDCFCANGFKLSGDIKVQFNADLLDQDTNFSCATCCLNARYI